MLALGLAGAALAGPVAADTLDGPGITRALAGHSVTYADGSSQSFRADGVTRYVSPRGSESLGRWRVEGGRYCSVWPPSGTWACYDVSLSGDDVVFLDDAGAETPGRVNP